MLRTSLGRVRTLVQVAAVALYGATLLPAAGLAASERPLDIGAALLMPAEVAQFGYDDYGIDTGRYASLDMYFDETGWTSGDSEADLDEFGMESVHHLALHPNGGHEENPAPDINIVSFVFVFEDEASAEAGFEAIEDESADDTATDLENPPALGEETDFTEYIYVDEDPDTGEPRDTYSLDLSFRIGRVMALVSVVGFDGDRPEREEVEAMGAIFEAKLLGVLDEGRINGHRTPGLDSIAPRYEGDVFALSRSHYCLLNGEAMPQAYIPGGQAQYQEFADDFGMIASYCSLEKVLLPSTDGAFLLLGVESSRFSQADGAEQYVAYEAEHATGPDSGYEQVELIDLAPEDLPFAADSVLAMTYRRVVVDETMYVTDLLVQQGRLTIQVRINGYSVPDLGVVLAVMADAVVCADNACYQTIEPPAELLDFQAEQDALLAEQ